MAKLREVQELNHLISAGNINFPSVPAKGSSVTIQVLYKDINAGNVTISIEQSTGTNKFDVVTGVSKQLNQSKTSHTFNLIGFNNDLIRAVLDIGGASAGEIEKILFIFE